MLNKKSTFIFMVITLLLLATQSANAIKLPKINLRNTLEQAAKSAGIVFLIKQFGGELNNFINKIFSDHSIPNVEATKIVPIITFGQGVEAGACQISGPADKIEKVQAVYSVAASLDKGHKFNIQALVPSSSINPLQINRVYGVGITAIIDYKL